MGMTNEQVLGQIDAVLEDLMGVRSEYAMYLDSGYHGKTPTEVWQTLERAEIRAQATLERFASPDSAYRLNLATDFDRSRGLVARLTALRQDVQSGYTQRIEELLHADVFGDFLAMADELLGKGFRGPAAVVIGCVLEEHLRKLSARSDVAIEGETGRPRKAEALNADLAKAEAYSKLEQKNVTAWLGLRNDAAHGNHEAFDAKQVEALIRDVRDFIVRHSA